MLDHPSDFVAHTERTPRCGPGIAFQDGVTHLAQATLSEDRCIGRAVGQLHQPQQRLGEAIVPPGESEPSGEWPALGLPDGAGCGFHLDGQFGHHPWIQGNLHPEKRIVG